MKPCTGCGSFKIIKHGLYKNKKGTFQTRKCKNCGKTRIDKRRK